MSFGLGGQPSAEGLRAEESMPDPPRESGFDQITPAVSSRPRPRSVAFGRNPPLMRARFGGGPVLLRTGPGDTAIPLCPIGRCFSWRILDDGGRESSRSHRQERRSWDDPGDGSDKAVQTGENSLRLGIRRIGAGRQGPIRFHGMENVPAGRVRQCVGWEVWSGG